MSASSFQRFRRPFRVIHSLLAAVVAAAVPVFPAAAATANPSSVQPAFALDFILFALTLIGVAVVHADPPHKQCVELPTIHAHVMMGDAP